VTLPFTRRSAMKAGIAGALLVPAAAQAAKPTRRGPSAREINSILDQFLAAYASVDIPKLVELMAEDIQFEDPTFHLVARNREEMKPIYAPLGTSFRNVRITPFNRIVAAPWGISQQRIAATLVRDGGRSHEIDVQGLSMLQIDQGRIKRWYDYYDVLTFRKQTGQG
jgi:limonene-1,2-epoxide hydrolase